MKTKTVLMGGLAVAIGCGLAGFVFLKCQEPPRAARGTSVARSEIPLGRAWNQARPTTLPTVDSAASQPLPNEADSNHTERAAAQTSLNGGSKTGVRTRPAPSQGKPAPRPKEKIQDPLARVALSFVGADPDAEAYWIDAINDPSLSAHERQDLIEDLNEDGFSDPRHPGPQDLPLIVNRLQLIEDLAPYAPDQVNWDAFLEAYKDLVNMLYGRPVQ